MDYDRLLVVDARHCEFVWVVSRLICQAYDSDIVLRDWFLMVQV